MLHTTIFLVWLAVNILFLFNFHLAAGYLVIVNLIYAAASTFPYGVDEYAVAGGIAGKPLELVRCRTADLHVPAQAEMILEGEILPDKMDHNWPFGEFSGYMAGRGKYPRFVVKHITHRKNPILLDLVAAHPPCDADAR